MAGAVLSVIPIACGIGVVWTFGDHRGGVSSHVRGGPGEGPYCHSQPSLSGTKKGKYDDCDTPFSCHVSWMEADSSLGLDGWY